MDYACAIFVLTWEEMDGWVVCVWDLSLDLGRNGWINYACGTLVLTLWEEMDGWCM